MNFKTIISLVILWPENSLNSNPHPPKKNQKWRRLVWWAAYFHPCWTSERTQIQVLKYSRTQNKSFVRHHPDETSSCATYYNPQICIKHSILRGIPLLFHHHLGTFPIPGANWSLFRDLWLLCPIFHTQVDVKKILSTPKPHCLWFRAWMKPSIYETENGRFGERNLLWWYLLYCSGPAWRLIEVPTSKIVIIMLPLLTIRHAPRYPSLRLYRLVIWGLVPWFPPHHQPEEKNPQKQSLLPDPGFVSLATQQLWRSPLT